MIHRLPRWFVNFKLPESDRERTVLNSLLKKLSEWCCSWCFFPLVECRTVKSNTMTSHKKEVSWSGNSVHIYRNISIIEYLKYNC